MVAYLGTGEMGFGVLKLPASSNSDANKQPAHWHFSKIILQRRPAAAATPRSPMQKERNKGKDKNKKWVH